MTATVESPNVETHQFQTETRKLLELMINSLYTQKEIFLRELISNASDALDRLRFEALTEPDFMEGDEELEIHLESDKKARTLTIRDNGIGMSREEVIQNIGTIAKSGSQELMEKIRESKSEEDVGELIGQFGVGFYSSFMAADRITLVTRRAGEDTATLWESVGDGTYTLSDGQRSGRGTTITLHLKDVDTDAGIEDYTDGYIASRIVKRFSDFVQYPIIQTDEREELETDSNGMPTKDGKMHTVIEKKTLNSMKPIWTRPVSEVKDEDYAEFYKHISHDWNPPMKTLRYEAEGRIEYQVLCFIPSEAPDELYYHAYEYGLQLYVRRVKIMDRCEDLVPRYLRFLRGIVDSADLPLNISRQRLQEDRHINQIRKWVTRKVLETLKTMQEEQSEDYLKFWENFGRSMKEGLTSDFDNKEKLLPLMLWHTSNDPEKLTTLAEYKDRMKEEQEAIYYLTGESREAVESSPHLETFKDKGHEVLYLIDQVDELVVQYLMDFDGTRLKSVGKGEVDLGTKEEKEQKEKETKEKEEKHKDLMELIQKKLDREIKWVRLSGRLTKSPACLVGADHDYSPQMERLLMKGKGGGPKQRWILELNPDHEIMTRMQRRFEGDQDDPILTDYSELLLGYAQIAQGSELTDAVIFNAALAKVMVDRIPEGAGVQAPPADPSPPEKDGVPPKGDKGEAASPEETPEKAQEETPEKAQEEAAEEAQEETPQVSS